MSTYNYRRVAREAHRRLTAELAENIPTLTELEVQAATLSRQWAETKRPNQRYDTFWIHYRLIGTDIVLEGGGEYTWNERGRPAETPETLLIEGADPGDELAYVVLGDDGTVPGLELPPGFTLEGDPESNGTIVALSSDSAFRKRIIQYVRINGYGNQHHTTRWALESSPNGVRYIYYGIVGEANAAARYIAENLVPIARQMRTGDSASMVPPVPTHDTSENLLRFLERSATRSIEAADLLSIPVPDHGTLSSRTWGIEVESGGARGAKVPKGWDAKRDGSLRTAYPDQPRRQDYSNEGRHIDCPCGCGVRTWMPNESREPRREPVDTSGDCREFVSPILHSIHSKGLQKLTEHLSTQPQNASAGIHVHVGASDLTPKQIGGLVFAYQMLEPMLEPLYRREVRTYCNPRSANQVMEVMKASKTMTGEGRGMGSVGGRYHTVNLNALRTHTTVEFRAMGPVYEYEYLIRWAYFVREMVNCAKSEAPAKMWTSVRSLSDVLAIFAKYGKETSPEMVSDLVDREENRQRLGISGQIARHVGV